MAKIHLTEEDAKRLLREAVAERGEDYVYPKPLVDHEGEGTLTSQCFYTHSPAMDGRDESEGLAAGCLVGLVLNKAGVPLGVLREHDNGTRARSFMGSLGYAGVLTFEEGAADILTKVQFRQDGGDTWGDSLRLTLGKVDLNKG
jgi:hypothetical protein